jgi:membrane-associated protease RseP (regulator of RpoE activity)
MPSSSPALRPLLRYRRLALAALALAALSGAAAAGEQRRVDRERVRVVVPAENRTILLDGGRRGFFGVHVLELTPELRAYFRAGEVGVLVSKVEADSPAAHAGVAVGDVLVAFDGEEVDSAWDLRHLVAPHEEGDEVEVTVVRDGRARELTAVVAAREGRMLELGKLLQRDGEGRQLLVLPSAGEWEDLGLRLGELGEEVGEAVAEAMSNPEVRWRVERELEDREGLQRKIELLERRLKDLERQLADQRR